MASHESAKKSIRKSAKRQIINTMRRSRIKTFVKKVEEALAQNLGKEPILAAFSTMQKEVMRGASKGIMHKNTASRKISKMCSRVKLAIGESR
ncbi:30S ribosomal protein S20 [Alphaproteobacteria bacterium]|nr:30S ribosomal protein S20 [Alphaproteobacteria bacterium]